jgi:DNA uptake protein ComE-like DNA-binding protein
MVLLGADDVLTAVQGNPERVVRSQGVPQKPAAKVDLNTAGAEEIARLPGMTDQIAQRIIERRPYRKLDELITKKVLGKKEFAQIREYIVIRSSKK